MTTKKGFLAFRVSPDLKNEIQVIADSEASSISQVCELLLSEGCRPTRKKGLSSCSAWLLNRKPRSKNRDPAPIRSQPNIRQHTILRSGSQSIFELGPAHKQLPFFHAGLLGILGGIGFYTACHFLHFKVQVIHVSAILIQEGRIEGESCCSRCGLGCH